MISRATLIFVLSFAVSVVSHADNNYTLDFQKGHDLKLVYDAGARPWKETSSTCMVGGAGMQDITHWKIVTSGGKSFEYASNMANFEVMEDYDVGRIDFSGVDDTPIQEAAAMTRAVCSSLNIPLTGFDETVAKINPLAKFNEHPIQNEGWQQRATIDGVDFFVSFMVRPFFDHTSAQVNITMQWPNRQADDPTFSKGPLKHLIRDLHPPAGYDGVSMAPPRPDPNQKGLPVHDLDYYKKQIEDAKKRSDGTNGY